MKNWTRTEHCPDWPDEAIWGHFVLIERQGLSAAQLLDSQYKQGGGWRAFGKDKWQFNEATHGLAYPGDPEMLPWAEASLNDERIFVYPSAWFAIVQPDGSLEVSRLD